MPEILYAESFLTDMESVLLETKQDEIFQAIDLLQETSTLGSTNLPNSIIQTYGPDVRKLVVRPFLVIYEHQQDKILVYGVVHRFHPRNSIHNKPNIRV